MRDVQANQTRYYHFDNQATTQALTDSTGAVTDRFASDAWGVQVKRRGSSINRHWYVGRAGYCRDMELGLDYLRLRYRRPGTGHFTSPDALHLPLVPAVPRGALLSSSRYQYAFNEPTAYADPTGLQRIGGTGRYANCCSPNSPETATSAP
jgi:RHS repeat-associated protein